MRFCLHGQTSIFYIYIAERENSRDTEKYFGEKECLKTLIHTMRFLAETAILKKQSIPWGHVGEGVETIQIKRHGL